MEVRDQRAMALKGIGEEGEEDPGGDKSAPPMKRRHKICYDFLSSIDSTGKGVILSVWFFFLGGGGHLNSLISELKLTCTPI